MALIPLTSSPSGFTVLDAADYSVPDDGTTDATVALQMLIARGKHIRLTPGKTYLVSGRIQLLAGQIIYGNGATIKRAAQVSTTTATTITQDVTTAITVASTTGFRVGQEITILNGSTYDTSNRVIGSIVGSVITVTTAFGISASGTTNVYISYYTVETAAGCRVYDLVIDGNKANWPFRRWENTVELKWVGDRNVIQGCYIHDAAGESIESDGTGDYITVSDCVVKDSNGNGIHFGGNNHVVVDRCRFINCNLDSAVGHADGCVIWSNTITNATISNCYMENGIAGIGSIDSNGNSDVTIIGNTIKSCTSYAIDIVCPGTDPGNIVIVGNRIYDSVLVSFNGTNAGAVIFPNRIVFANNFLSNTNLICYRTRYVSITGNLFEDSADTTSKQIEINSAAKHTVVADNTIIGGQYAVYVDDANVENVLIQGNQMINQNLHGVRVNNASIRNLIISNNVISNDSTASASYDAILHRDSQLAIGNVINLNKGHAGIYAQDGSITLDNVVRHGTASFSIRANTGSNSIIKNNQVTAAVSDGGTNTNITANVTIS